MVEIVLDKSYLDGAATAEVADVCERYTALMPQELFFEMMTTCPESQRRCFAKLPERYSPVALIPPVGVLVEFERRHHEPCVPLSRHRVDGHRYAFNPRLRDGTFIPSREDSNHLAVWRGQVDSDIRAFMNTCLGIPDVFPHLKGLRQPELRSAVERAVQTIATDANFVRGIYSAGAPSDAPHADRIDPRWAVFRLFQCRTLSALRIFARYQGAVPDQAGSEFWRRAEHSMHDVYYLILGSLAGSLATFDNEIKNDFLLLCPDSVPRERGLFTNAEG